MTTYGDIATAEIQRYVCEAHAVRNAALDPTAARYNRQLAVASFAKAYRLAVMIGVTREAIDFAIRTAEASAAEAAHADWRDRQAQR
jgi:hypothetical protein